MVASQVDVGARGRGRDGECGGVCTSGSEWCDGGRAKRIRVDDPPARLSKAHGGLTPLANDARRRWSVGPHTVGGSARGGEGCGSSSDGERHGSCEEGQEEGGDSVKRGTDDGCTVPTNPAPCYTVRALTKPHTCHVRYSRRQLNPQPAFIAHRIQLYDAIKAKHVVALAAKERTPINVTLRDGKVIAGRAWETTPFSIAESLSKSLANNAVIARVQRVRGRLGAPEDGAVLQPSRAANARVCWPPRILQVNGALWDLNRPLEYDARLELLDFNDTEGVRRAARGDRGFVKRERERDADAIASGCAVCVRARGSGAVGGTSATRLLALVRTHSRRGLRALLRKLPRARPSDRRRLLLRHAPARVRAAGDCAHGPRPRARHRRLINRSRRTSGLRWHLAGGSPSSTRTTPCWMVWPRRSPMKSSPLSGSR